MLDHDKMATIAFKAEGETVWLLGPQGTHWASRSICARSSAARKAKPRVDLALERRNGEQVREWIADGKVTAVHDISDGGLLVALTEMALAGKIGVTLDAPLTTAQAFGEDQSRYVVTTPAGVELEGAVKLGTTGGRPWPAFRWQRCAKPTRRFSGTGWKADLRGRAGPRTTPNPPLKRRGFFSPLAPHPLQRRGRVVEPGQQIARIDAFGAPHSAWARV
jgi:hypothetical protein